MHIRKPLLRRSRKAASMMVLLILLSGLAYCYNIVVMQSPRRVFYDALSGNLDLKGVMCTVSKSSSGQSSDQQLWLDLKGTRTTLVTTTLSQNGTKVTTQDINTQGADYVRYTRVATNAKDKAGKSLDVSKILNVWAKKSESANTPMLGQVALGGCIVPLVSVPTDKQAAFSKQLSQGIIFQTDFSKSTYHWRFDEPYREYTVTVDPDQYIPFMKQVDQAYGLHALDKVSSSNYQQKTPQRLMFRIGAGSHRIQNIWYTDRSQTFTFSHYDERPYVAIPVHTISITDLQQRLQALR